MITIQDLIDELNEAPNKNLPIKVNHEFISHINFIWLEEASHLDLAPVEEDDDDNYWENWEDLMGDDR